MIQDLLIPFVTVGLAELGDKTQLTLICLSSKTKKYLWLLIGAILAFAIVDGIAIALGGLITQFIPIMYIKIVSGAVFVLFGILTIKNHKEEENKCELKNPFLSGFGLMFVSELGDKTQITAGLFATQYNPWLVFAGVITVLSLLSVTAIFLGQIIERKIPKKMISMIAGILFIVIGIAAIVSGIIG